MDDVLILHTVQLFYAGLQEDTVIADVDQPQDLWGATCESGEQEPRVLYGEQAM